MARSLYQTLTRTSQPALFATKSPSVAHPSRVAFRSLSSQSENPHLADADTEQRDLLAVQKIEDAIHGIIVKRSAPDWLPFVPGSSYWVPPRRKSYGIADLVDKLSNNLSGEEVMSLTTSRGWPSAAFYVHGAYPDTSGNVKTSKKCSEPGGATSSSKSSDAGDEDV